jgi:NADH dehydrogenase
MRIVVTGGSGFIGRAVVERLLSTNDHQIVVATRDPARAQLFPGRVTVVQAFAGDALSLGRACTGADVLVHALQFPHHPVERPSRGWTYAEVDGRGTQVAVGAARRVGVRRIVYLSGAGAGRGRPEPWFRAKDRAAAAITGSGLEYAILRPSWIYGPGDRSMNRLVTFCRLLPVVPVIGDGSTPVWPLHVDDAARYVVEAAQRADARALTFEVGGPQRLTQDEVLQAILRVLDKHRPLLHLPAALMKALAWPLQCLPSPALSPGAIDFLTQVAEIDPRPAMGYFGFEPRPLERGLSAYVQRRF